MCWVARTCVAGALLILLAVHGSAAEPHRVLLLHSFGPHFEPWSAVAGPFREELKRRSPNAIDLYEASLEMARLSQPTEEAPLVDYMRALFAGRDLDLVVAVGAPAARFFQTAALPHRCAPKRTRLLGFERIEVRADD